MSYTTYYKMEVVFHKQCAMMYKPSWDTLELTFQNHSPQWSSFMWMDTQMEINKIGSSVYLDMQTCNSPHTLSLLLEVLLIRGHPPLVYLWHLQLSYKWPDFRHGRMSGMSRYMNEIQLSVNPCSSVKSPYPYQSWLGSLIKWYTIKVHHDFFTSHQTDDLVHVFFIIIIKIIMKKKIVKIYTLCFRTKCLI